MLYKTLSVILCNFSFCIFINVCNIRRMLQFHVFFLNNRFLSNFMNVKNMMLWNEKPNKNETLPWSIVFMRYQRCHIFNFVLRFSQTSLSAWNHRMHHQNITNNSIFQFKAFYYTHKLLNITIQLMIHIYKLSITLFTTNIFSANLFILRDVFLSELKFCIIEFHQILPIYYPMLNKHKRKKKHVVYQVNLF